MRVTSLGTGNVRSITAARLAEAGNRVLCVNVDDGKMGQLKRGEIPIANG